MKLIDERAQNELNLLSLKKISWKQFKERFENFFAFSRLSASHSGRSLLHLAVLDNQLDVIQDPKSISGLRSTKDALGLTPLDFARFLSRKEVLSLLKITQPTPEYPPLERFEHLSYPIFETTDGFEQVLASVAKAKKEDQIPSEKIWMGIYFDQELSKGGHPPVAIRPISKEIGFGVFSKKKILPCSYVGEYTGVIQQRSPEQLKEKRYCVRYTIWGGKKNFTIDAEEKGNFTRFINHSTTPNLALQSVYWRGIPRMIFVALREILEDEQLTFDYGPIFWKNR